MRGQVKYGVAALLLVVAWGGFYGCSPQKRLAHRLKAADRVVVAYPPDGLSITVRGEEVTKVIHSLAFGKKESSLIEAGRYLVFQFFRGDELVATVPTSTQVFWIGRTPYSDPTGTLEALTQRYREEHPPQAR